jgi:hypothetical protein
MHPITSTRMSSHVELFLSAVVWRYPQSNAVLSTSLEFDYVQGCAPSDQVLRRLQIAYSAT